MAGKLEPYRVEPLTDAELASIRERAVGARAECVGGADEENLRYWDEVLSLIAEVRRLRGNLDEQIRQSQVRLGALRDLSKAASSTSVGERVMGEAIGRHDSLQELRRGLYGSVLPEPS
jgi:hypothetical protein